MLTGQNCVIDARHVILKFKVFQISRVLANAGGDGIIWSLNGLCHHFPPLLTSTCCAWSISHPPNGAVWSCVSRPFAGQDDFLEELSPEDF